MSQQNRVQISSTLALEGTSERELLGRFTSRNGGFQVSGQSSYRKHEQWRNDVLRGLKLLEDEGLLMVRQLVPCQRHQKCAGQPVAAGCELTQRGRKLRDLPPKALSPELLSWRAERAGSPARER